MAAEASKDEITTPEERDEYGIFGGLLVYLAHLAWHRGDGEQAGRYAAEALAAGRRIDHPFSQAIARPRLIRL